MRFIVRVNCNYSTHTEAADPPAGGWTVVQNKRETARASKKQPSQPQPTMDQRSFKFVHGKQTKLSRNEVER